MAHLDSIGVLAKTLTLGYASVVAVVITCQLLQWYWCWMNDDSDDPNNLILHCIWGLISTKPDDTYCGFSWAEIFATLFCYCVLIFVIGAGAIHSPYILGGIFIFLGISFGSRIVIRLNKRVMKIGDRN